MAPLKAQPALEALWKDQEVPALVLGAPLAPRCFPRYCLAAWFLTDCWQVTGFSFFYY